MLSRGHGRIVNVSSGAGFAAVPMLSAYAVSKAGLYRFSENLAAETRGHGVMVFAVNPGLVRTAMSESALACGEPSIERWVQGRLRQPGGCLHGIGGHLATPASPGEKVSRIGITLTKNSVSLAA